MAEGGVDESTDKINFTLYDEDFNVYVARVTPAEAALLRIDGNKCFQKLKALKAAEKDRGASSKPMSSQSKPKKGKKPRKWDDFSADKLVVECLKYRKWLRRRVPPADMWIKITDELNKVLNPHAKYEGHYKFEITEVKEKIRTLKSTFRDAKKGQHGGDKWGFYWYMCYIYDEPILDGEVTLAPEGLNFSQLEFELHGSELIPLASSSMIRSSPSQLNQSKGEQIEVNNNESDTSHHIADKYQDLGVGVIDEEVFKYLEHETENEEGGVKDDDIVVTLQVQHKQKSNAEIAGNLSGDLSVINEEEIVVENDERHVTDRDAIDNAGDTFLQFVHEKKSIQVRGPQSPVTGSPSKKKLKKTAGVSVNANILKSPSKNSPRKRKVPKSSLNWGIEMTKNFVSECENLKQEVQGSTTISPATWKSISTAMKTNHGVEVDWDVCRDKFIQMRDLFLETLLPVEGYLAGQKWPYYDEFCTLYDIPKEFHSIIICRNGGDNLEEEDDDDDEAEPHKGSKLWPTPNVELLLDLFKLKKDDFESTKSFLKHDLLYSQLALEINDFTGCNYKSKQCQDKMGRLNDKFRKEYDSCNRTGAKPSTWPFYERMLDMFKGSPNLISPYVASVGRGLLYSVKGQVKASCSSEVGSKSRPKNEYKPKERKQTKGKTSVKSCPRSKQQELQERKLANQETLTEEIRLLRLGLEEGRRDRKKYMAKLLDDN